MKKIFHFLFFFFSLLLIQCHNEDKKIQEQIFLDGPTKITGYIQNRDIYPNTKDVRLKIPTVSGDHDVVFTSPINDDGTFQFSFDLVRSQDVTLQPYIDFLYLTAGDSLHVELDFKTLSVTRLSGGKSAEINNDLYKYFSSTGYTGRYGIGTDCAINCSLSEIIEKYNEQRDGDMKRKQEFLKKNKVCEEVVFLTEAIINLDYYTGVVGTMMQRKHIYHKEIMDWEKLKDELDEVAIKYFNSGLYSKSHFRFIGSVYMPVAAFGEPSYKFENFTDWSKEVAKTDTIRNFMLAVWSSFALSTKDLEKFENSFVNINHEYLQDRLMKEYQETLKNMHNPNLISSSILEKPSDFSNSKLPGGNLIEKTVSPNYGKAQVINIWASWCRPCHEVLEQYKFLIDDYTGKDVSFSFLCCLSSDQQKVLELFRAKGLNESSNHFCSIEEYRFLAQTFSPLGFPYGILTNRQGVIVDYGFHIRPGKALKEKINLLLEQDNLVK